MIDKWTNLVVKRAWVKSRTSKKEITGYQSIVHVSKTHRITCCVGLKHMFLRIVWLQIQKPQSISRGYRLRVFIWNKPKIVSFFGGSVVKSPPASARDVGLIPGSGRSPGEGNGNPLQYSCLGNPKDRGHWRITLHGITKWHNLTTKQQQQHS